MCMCLHVNMYTSIYIHVYSPAVGRAGGEKKKFVQVQKFKDSLLDIQCDSFSISSLNLICLFSTERGNRDVEFVINDSDLRMKK